ncbi:hypothetical protein TWF281_001534 [Arthrobotrys megalospora]
MNNITNDERKGKGRAPGSYESPPPSPKRAKPEGETQLTTPVPASSSQSGFDLLGELHKEYTHLDVEPSADPAVLNRPKHALRKKTATGSNADDSLAALRQTVGPTSRPPRPRASLPITELLNAVERGDVNLGSSSLAKAPMSLPTGDSTILPDFSSRQGQPATLQSAPTPSASAAKSTKSASQVKSTKTTASAPTSVSTAAPAYSWGTTSSVPAPSTSVPVSGRFVPVETPADVLAAARAGKKPAPRDWETPVDKSDKVPPSSVPAHSQAPTIPMGRELQLALENVWAFLKERADSEASPKAVASSSAGTSAPTNPLPGAAQAVAQQLGVVGTDVTARESSAQSVTVTTSTGESAPTWAADDLPSPFLRPLDARGSTGAKGQKRPTLSAVTQVAGESVTVAPPVQAGLTVPSIAGGNQNLAGREVSTSSAVITPAVALSVQQPSQQPPTVANSAPKPPIATDMPVIALQDASQTAPRQQPIFPSAVVAADKDEGDLPDAPPYTIVHVAVDREIDMHDAPSGHDDQDENVVMTNAPVLRAYGGRRIMLSRKHVAFLKKKETLYKRGKSERQKRMTINLRGTSLFPEFCRNFTDPQVKIDQGGVYLVGRSGCKWPKPVRR